MALRSLAVRVGCSVESEYALTSKVKPGGVRSTHRCDTASVGKPPDVLSTSTSGDGDA